MTAPTKPTPPPGVAPRIWLVIWPDGQRNYIEKEPLGGMPAWAKGVNATILEYTFGGVRMVLRPPAVKKP